VRPSLAPKPPLDPLAAYASIDSLEGVPALAPVQPGVSPQGRALATVRRLSPGLAIAALWRSQRPGWRSTTQRL
jgi:hypothetical protein